MTRPAPPASIPAVPPGLWSTSDRHPLPALQQDALPCDTSRSNTRLASLPGGGVSALLLGSAGRC